MLAGRQEQTKTAELQNQDLASLQRKTLDARFSDDLVAPDIRWDATPPAARPETLTDKLPKSGSARPGQTLTLPLAFPDPLLRD